MRGDAQEEQMQAVKVNIQHLELVREPAPLRPRATAQRLEPRPHSVHHRLTLTESSSPSGK